MDAVLRKFRGLNWFISFLVLEKGGAIYTYDSLFFSAVLSNPFDAKETSRGGRHPWELVNPLEASTYRRTIIYRAYV